MSAKREDSDTPLTDKHRIVFGAFSEYSGVPTEIARKQERAINSLVEALHGLIEAINSGRDPALDPSFNCARDALCKAKQL